MYGLSLFDPLFENGCSNRPAYRANSFVPKVDAKETKNAYILDMDLPGFTENDIEIDLKDSILRIASKEKDADKKAEEKEEFQWLIHERKNESFESRFSLPQDIDAESINAVFKNGVLTITIPRKLGAGSRKINISAA